MSKPVEVYRGVGVYGDTAKGLVEVAQKALESGGTVEMAGFVSTSTSKGSKFSGDVQLKINAVHGLDLLPYTRFGSEKELLLNHGSKFKVKSVKEDTSLGGKWVIELDQLPPHYAGESTKFLPPKQG